MSFVISPQNNQTIYLKNFFPDFSVDFPIGLLLWISWRFLFWFVQDFQEYLLLLLKSFFLWFFFFGISTEIPLEFPAGNSLGFHTWTSQALSALVTPGILLVNSVGTFLKNQYVDFSKNFIWNLNRDFLKDFRNISNNTSGNSFRNSCRFFSCNSLGYFYTDSSRDFSWNFNWNLLKDFFSDSSWQL